MFRKPEPFFVIVKLFISPLVASGHLLVREAAEDTVLEIPKPHGQVGTTIIPIPKGVQVTSFMIPLKTFLAMVVMSALGQR